MTVLSKSDWNFWQENGYVIIPNAVPQEQLDRTVEAIWWFLDMAPNDSNTWYRYKPYTREDRSSPCLLYTSPSPRDGLLSRMPSSA